MSAAGKMTKQDELNAQTDMVIEEQGGNNYLYAEYMRYVAETVLESDETFTDRFQPDIKCPLEQKAYEEAFKIVLGYLKLYKMRETIKVINAEFPDTPAKSGFSRRSELDSCFANLSDTMKTIRKKKFETTVAEFAEQAGLPPSQKKQRKAPVEKLPPPKENKTKRRH